MDNIKGIYQHFKGGKYFVYRTAKATDDSGREFVVYESMEDGQWYVRDKDEFFGYPIVKKFVGEEGAWYDVVSEVPRFVKLY